MRPAPGGDAPRRGATPAVAVDPWDLRHLLLSVADRPRGAGDQTDIDGVVGRAAAALAALPARPPIAVPAALTAPLRVEGLPLWIMETNAWVVAGADGDCVVVDVPPSPAPLVARITELGLRVTAVVVTHAHADHSGGVGELLRALAVRVPVYVHSGDRELLLHPEGDGVLVRVAPGISPPPRRALVDLDEGTELTLGGLAVRALPAPGHTPGSTCVLVDGAARPLLFTGDTLFAGRTGRCDLRDGSRALADASLRAVLAPLADDTLVLPGHGGVTTIGDERQGPLALGPRAA